MPNHITNIVRINGSQKQIEKVLDTISTTKDGEVNNFDFNTIIPMPKELEGTTSPTNIVSKEEREEQLKALKAFNKKGTKGFAPRVDLTQELKDKYLKEFGATDWYRWRIDNWDTKWGAYDISVEDNQVTFDTAWGHPTVIIEKLSELFPSVLFHIQYADEDIGHNLGEYTIKDNEVNTLVNFTEGSDEAIRFACEIKRYDYQEYLEEQEE